jgi:opacity protein-like surface antigen
MAKAGFALTVAAAALAGSIAAASAADMPVKAPMIAPVIAAYDWSGWYAGVGIGGLWGDSRWVEAGFTITPTFEQAMAGPHGGYQWHFKAWQNGGIVVGMEYAGSSISTNSMAIRLVLTRLSRAKSKWGICSPSEASWA